jgi:hypothetical protein
MKLTKDKELAALDLGYFKFLFKRNPRSQAEFRWFRKKLDYREYCWATEINADNFYMWRTASKGKRDLSAYCDDDCYFNYDECNVK